MDKKITARKPLFFGGEGEVRLACDSVGEERSASVRGEGIPTQNAGYRLMAVCELCALRR